MTLGDVIRLSFTLSWARLYVRRKHPDGEQEVSPAFDDPSLNVYPGDIDSSPIGSLRMLWPLIGTSYAGKACLGLGPPCAVWDGLEKTVPTNVAGFMLLAFQCVPSSIRVVKWFKNVLEHYLTFLFHLCMLGTRAVVISLGTWESTIIHYCKALKRISERISQLRGRG